MLLKNFDGPGYCGKKYAEHVMSRPPDLKIRRKLVALGEKVLVEM